MYQRTNSSIPHLSWTDNSPI